MTIPDKAGDFACPVCEGKKTKVYLDTADIRLDVSLIGSSRRRASPGRILRCEVCGFGFRQLRSSQQELSDLYSRMDTTAYESEKDGRGRTARRHLEIVERNARRGRLLDVGCASGLLLVAAAERGWQVTGVEPSEALCAEAQKRLDGRGEIHCATLEDARLGGQFDVVTLWDVLEHVPDPCGFLGACRMLLRPTGRLFLNVPDLESLEARVLGARWPLLLPEHLNYFTRRSLQRCAQRAGLTLVRFGRRRVSFSVRYVAHRLAQHSVPTSTLLCRLASGSLGKILIPVSMGETYGIWAKGEPDSRVIAGGVPD